MPRIRTLAALAVCALPWAAPATASSFSATLSGFIDDADGTSLDLDLYWAPAEWLALSAGVGSTDSSADLADLSGDSLRAGIDVHGESLGGRLGWRQWRDSGDFESESISAELYWRSGVWQIGLIGEQRDFRVDYVIIVAGRPVTRSAAFEGQGFGAEVSWYAERWSGYLRAVGYDYDATLEAAVAASRLPNLARFPRIEALVGSLLTRAAGAIDHDLAAGLERAFQRSGLRFEVSATRDTVSGADSLGASLGYRYSLNSRLEIEATIGAVDSDDLDAVGFAGLALTLRN
jgi:hypothetical protein